MIPKRLSSQGSCVRQSFAREKYCNKERKKGPKPRALRMQRERSPVVQPPSEDMEMKRKWKKPGYTVCISMVATLDTSLDGKGAENIIFHITFSQHLPFSWFCWTRWSSHNVGNMLWRINSVARKMFIACNSYRQTSKSHFIGAYIRWIQTLVQFLRIKHIFRGTYIIVLLRPQWQSSLTRDLI